MQAYMVSASQHGTCSGISTLAEPNRLSRDFLHADGFALRNALAVPIRAKARRGYRARKSNVGEEQQAEQRQDEQSAQDVAALRIPRKKSQKSHDHIITPVRTGAGTDFRAAVNLLSERVKKSFSTSFLDFHPFRAFNPRTSRKDVLFDPPPGP